MPTKKNSYDIIDFAEDLSDFVISSNKWSQKEIVDVLSPLEQYNDESMGYGMDLSSIDEQLIFETDSKKRKELEHEKQVLLQQITKNKAKVKPNPDIIREQFVENQIPQIISDFCQKGVPSHRKGLEVSVKNMCALPITQVMPIIKPKLISAFKENEEYAGENESNYYREWRP